MSWYGFKKSMIAESPILVVADSRIITDAPMRLTASGVGDLLGKYTALADGRSQIFWMENISVTVSVRWNMMHWIN